MRVKLLKNLVRGGVRFEPGDTVTLRADQAERLARAGVCAAPEKEAPEQEAPEQEAKEPAKRAGGKRK